MIFDLIEICDEIHKAHKNIETWWVTVKRPCSEGDRVQGNASIWCSEINIWRETKCFDRVLEWYPGKPFVAGFTVDRLSFYYLCSLSYNFCWNLMDPKYLLNLKYTCSYTFPAGWEARGGLEYLSSEVTLYHIHPSISQWRTMSFFSHTSNTVYSSPQVLH